MLVEELVNTKEAAELVRVSHWTISAWLSQGKLRRVKAGGRTLIAKSDLEAFLRRDGTSGSGNSKGGLGSAVASVPRLKGAKGGGVNG